MTLTTWLRRITITLLSFGLTALSAQADDTSSQSYELDIDALPLTAAVKTLSDETGIEVLFFSEIAEGVTSSPVQGEYTPTEALETMLNSTDLKVVDLKKEGAVAIAMTATDERGASDSKNSPPTPVLMAQSQMSQAQTTSSRSDDGGTGIVTGKVTDARTGANLKGAKVTIEETGQWVSTSNLGRFRFVNIPDGKFTLVVSFLGYAAVSERISISGEVQTVTFQLDSVFDEIIVLGAKSGRMQALNQERTAQNSMTVISADYLGNFNGTTISEALRRAPGIAFVPDSVTGEGSQVIVRGLRPELNQVQLNGVNLLDATGAGRAPDLSNILTENIESVTINTTLLPSQTSNGAGALIEIETKSPLDRSQRFASFNAQYGEVGDDFGDEFEIGGTISGIFGTANDFGISLSAAYRERERTSIGYSLSTTPGPYLPLDDDGNPITRTSAIDPLAPFPFGVGSDELYVRGDGYGYSEGSNTVETLSLNATFEKLIGTHTDLRFDLGYNENTVSGYNSGLSVNGTSRYDTGPLGIAGDERSWLVAEDPFRSRGSLADRFGRTLLGSLSRSTTFNPNDISETTTLSLRGKTVLDQWGFGYNAGYSRSESDGGDRFELTFANIARGPSGGSDPRFTRIADRDDLLPEALSNTTDDGRIISIFAPLSQGQEGFVFPLFSNELFNYYNNIDNVDISNLNRFTQGQDGFGESVSLGFSARRNFSNPVLDFVEVGFDYSDDRFSAPGDGFSPLQEVASFQVAEDASGNPIFSNSDLGIFYDESILGRVGVNGGFNTVSRSNSERLFNNLNHLVNEGLLVQTNTSASNFDRSLETGEEFFAGYIEGRLVYGDLEVIGGARLEQVEVAATSFLSPSVRFIDSADPDVQAANDERAREIREELGGFVTESASQTKIMPRVLANYRFNENTILRGGYFVTVSRPQLSNVTRFRSVTLDQRPRYGENNDQAQLSVSEGNPDLKPSRTHNFDLRFEHYFKDTGVFKASAFYKEIEDPLQANTIQGGLEVLPQGLVLPDIPEFTGDTLDGIFVQVREPINGDQSHEIWGFDVSVEYPLGGSYAPLEGVSAFGNYTYTDSSSVQRITVSTLVDSRGFVEFDDVPFEGSPENQGTVGLLYSRFGVDASLLYTWQDRRLGQFRANFLHLFDEEIDTLDLQLSYTYDLNGSPIRFFLEGNDLLNDAEDPFLQTSLGGVDGVPKYFNGATYLGGRSFAVGISAQFY